MTQAPLTREDLVNTLVAYSTQKLGKADRHQEPFPYLSVEKLLPSSAMEAINQFYPKPEEMPAMPEERTGNPYAHRYRRLFPLNAETIKLMQQPQRRFWKVFAAYCERLTPTLLDALPTPPEGQRYRTVDPGELRTRIDLWSDQGGYQITPHTDAPHKLATFLFYCSSDPSLTDEGTSIYRPRDPELTCWSGRQWPAEDFEEVYRSPYTANRLFGFRKTDRSFHGKKTVGEANSERRLIAITIQTNESFVQ
jgi:hypothetical protein